MEYIEVKINTSIQGLDIVSSTLLEVDITDIVINDPRDIDSLLQKENGYEWDYIDDSVLALSEIEPSINIYLEHSEENLQKLAIIKAEMANLIEQQNEGAFNFPLGNLDVEWCIQKDDQWKDNWKEYFKPAKISKKIVVKPTWENYERIKDELVIEIDPGMAFGTGTHETTSLCVKLMEKYLKKGDKVLDVGTGSGILAIAAALLGSEDVLAIEIDPVAVEVAKENVTLNNQSESIKVIKGDLTKGVDFTCEIVVANLMADLVVMLSKDVAKHMHSSGIFISSGILLEKKDWVADAITEAGFEVIEIAEDGMWCAIAARYK